MSGRIALAPHGYITAKERLLRPYGRLEDETLRDPVRAVIRLFLDVEHSYDRTPRQETSPPAANPGHSRAGANPAVDVGGLSSCDSSFRF